MIALEELINHVNHLCHQLGGVFVVFVGGICSCICAM